MIRAWSFSGIVLLLICGACHSAHEGREDHVPVPAASATTTHARATTGPSAPPPKPTLSTSAAVSDAGGQTAATRAPPESASATNSDSSMAVDPRDYQLHPDTLIRLVRTVCFGSCPVYSVAIRGDGRVFFYGNAHTRTLGFATSRTTPAAVAALLAFMRKRDFLSLPTSYPARATDNPSAITMLRQATVAHEISHDLSNSDNPALKEIEEQIDRVAGSARWVGPSQAGSRRYVSPPELTAKQFGELAGNVLPRVEQACPAQTPTKVEIGGSINRDGHLELHVFHVRNGTGARSLMKCVQRVLSTIEFPIVDVAQVQPLQLTLHP